MLTELAFHTLSNTENTDGTYLAPKTFVLFLSDGEPQDTESKYDPCVSFT